MVTNEERREVAEKLREYDASHSPLWYRIAEAFEVPTTMTFREFLDMVADLIEPEENFKWQPVTETEPPGKTVVLCKGVRGFPYVASRCTNYKTGELLNNFYFPVAYGGRNQYKKPVMWCPIPTAEKVVNDE